VFIITPPQGAPGCGSYMFAGISDEEVDEIRGRWWSLDSNYQSYAYRAETIVFTRKKSNGKFW